MSIDPLTEEYEDYTPYQFSSNQPVHAMELEGLESSNDLNKRDKQEHDPNSFRGKIARFFLNLALGLGDLGATVEGKSANTIEQKLEHVDSGFMFVVDNSLFLEGVMTINRAPSDGETRVSYSKNATTSVSKTSSTVKVNGNSKSSTNLQHGYEIINETKGTRHKVGVSGGSLNKNGTSRRANSQVNKLNAQGGDVYKAEVKVKNVPGRENILIWEQTEVNKHYKKMGVTPPGQKRPKPTGTE